MRCIITKDINIRLWRSNIGQSRGVHLDTTSTRAHNRLRASPARFSLCAERAKLVGVAILDMQGSVVCSSGRGHGRKYS